MTQLRTESFIPLTAASASPERREFAVTVLHGEAAQKNFQSLAVPSPIKPVAAPPLCEPKVTVQRDGKRVTHLHIQCTCGQTIDLACLYEAESP